MSVVEVDGDFKVKVDLFVCDPNEDTPVVTEHHEREEDIEDVQKIIFNGLDGNDNLAVYVNSSEATLLDGIELEFNGAAGNDTLYNNELGGLKTTASGGQGDDTLYGSRFDDTFDGGVDNDFLIGYCGNDTYVFAGLNLGTDEIDEDANVDTDTLDFSGFQSFVNVHLERVFSRRNPSFAVHRPLCRTLR